MAERRSLFEDSDEFADSVSAAHRNYAGLVTRGDLLPLMATVMRHRSGDQTWAARAVNCEKFGYGHTAEEAMREALKLREMPSGKSQRKFIVL